MMMMKENVKGKRVHGEPTAVDAAAWPPEARLSDELEWEEGRAKTEGGGGVSGGTGQGRRRDRVRGRGPTCF